MENHDMAPQFKQQALLATPHFDESKLNQREAVRESPSL
jgi:hypothetical protein